jgi:2'-5' RNA ligase
LAAGAEKTAVVLPLDRAERVFGDLRRANVHELTAYVPAHVTLAHPLPPAEDLPVDGLAALFAATTPFEVTLDGFGRFPVHRVLYLRAEPAAHLKRLADACFAAVPGAAPEWDPHVFHMTLVQGGANLDAAEASVARRFAADVPMTERVERAELYAKFAGGWRLKEVFAFGG